MPDKSLSSASIGMDDARSWTGELLSSVQVSNWLQISVKTLQKMRTKGTGPDFIKPNRNCVRYPKDAVDFWLRQRTGSSTADFNEGKRGNAS